MKNKLSPQNTPDWMVVYISHDIRDAHIIAGRLEHENIPHIVHTQPGASAMGLTLGNMGEIKVLVKPEFYDLAMELLFPAEVDELPDDGSQFVQGLDDE